MPAVIPSPAPRSTTPPGGAVVLPKVIPPAGKVPAQPALGLLDEALHRLRLAPASVLGIYYASTLPFLLALLYFWADQSRSPDAASRAVGGALTVVALFVVMKIGHAVFTARLTELLRRDRAAAWTWARLGRLAFVQAVVQPPGLFILTLASILTVPLGWTYAFYQNVTIFGDGSPGSTRTAFRRAWRAALRQPRQNHAGLSILSLLSFFVTLNVLTAVVGIPYLLKMFTGEENLVTRSGWHLFNSTFFAIVFALIYLALDPLAKAFYTLRCFYEDSLRTGEDLLAELAALPPPAALASAVAATATADTRTVPAAARRPATTAARTALLVLAGTLCLLPVRPLAASAMPPPSVAPAPAAAPGNAPAPPARSISPPELGRSIDDVLHRRKFAWRSPRADQEAEKDGPFDAFLKSIRDWCRARLDTLGHWFSIAMRWLRRWWHPREPDAKPSAGFGGVSADTLRQLMIVLATLLGGTILYLGWRQWQARRAPVVAGRAVPVGTVPLPDLADDGVLATQLPEDGWIRLAQTLLQNGERRLALRAFYLSALSSLAARGLIGIARHKSNRDYLLELRRRVRDQPELQGAFGRVVARFERVWYGSHPADDALLAEFQADRQRVLG